MPPDAQVVNKNVKFQESLVNKLSDVPTKKGPIIPYVPSSPHFSQPFLILQNQVFKVSILMILHLNLIPGKIQ